MEKKYRVYKKEGNGYRFVDGFDELVPAMVFAKKIGNAAITKIRKGKEVVVAEY